MFALRQHLRTLLRHPRAHPSLSLPLARPRYLHHSLTPPPIPPPSLAVPDVTTFLTKIGRNTSKHAAKIGTWEQLFAATSAQLKELGVEPARDRRYIIRWRETFRRAAEGGMAGDAAVEEVGEGGAGEEEEAAMYMRLVEQKRGRKIDGGERRRKMVRAKRFAAERKAREEAEAGMAEV